MKKLELKTSKGVFFLIDGYSDGRIQLPTDIEYQELGRVKNMTEEQFAEIVDNTTWRYTSGGSDTVYRNYLCNNELSCSVILEKAKDSFDSLIHSLGWYLWENPLDSTKYLFEEGKDQNKFFVRLPKRKWQEAESKKLYNPILLKKI